MINLDGELFGEDSNYLNADNRGFSHGEALVEEIRIVPGKIYFWEDHYLRLMASMRILRLEIPMNFTMEYLQEEINRTISESGLSNDPVIAHFYVFPKNTQTELPASRDVAYLIRLKKHPSPFYLHLEKEYEVDLYKDFYVQAGMLSNLPTVNKTLKTIGAVYALENGYADCILLNDHKNVVETLNGNLFLVEGEKIKTAPLSDGCENGILRKKMIEILKKSSEYTLEEVSISPFELQKADELFITGVSFGIQSVTQYRKATYKSDVARLLLGKLNAVARLN
jgi:branched-chain amino acid aminotransferase